ncbi:hypothetical protein VQ042_18750 [Aurantimonas sp. A2-1-M11]|uniref:hypothetical protein n=1 Tax=Aurantimonas sp. A2-1-M11 TaxID=3113712 RepID=UPI002F95A886
MTAVLALLFFSPLAFIYGRYRARQLRARPGTLAERLVSLVPAPLLLAGCAALAIVHANAPLGTGDDVLATGNGVIDFVLRIARWIGELELILFMVAIPYLLGAAIAALLLVLDARGVARLAAPAPDASANTDSAP